MPYIEIAPAYGRDYKNVATIKADWVAGKDFTVVESVGLDIPTHYGQALNNESIARYAPTATVNVRYAKQEKLTTVKK